MNRREIEDILAAAGTRPTRRLGQHFMMDQRVLDQIIQVAELTAEDIILEVGPGPGNLTSRLSPLVRAVAAVDLDAPLLAAASHYWEKLRNVHWLHADVLAGKHRINPAVTNILRSLKLDHSTGSIKLVSNLPYNVASPLIVDILAAQCADYQQPESPSSMPIERLVFTVQWEVGQRMKAAPGTDHYGSLSVLIALMADVEVLAAIAPGAFWPPPKVKSALIRIMPRERKMRQIADVQRLQDTVSNLFSHRRQNISNAIRHSLQPPVAVAVLEKVRAVGLDPAHRSESLSPDEFLRLSECWPSRSHVGGQIASNGSSGPP
jgi:16S rRNA (adenine1518-N6/adenine1519-N6)-dimethyltransferase